MLPSVSRVSIFIDIFQPYFYREGEEETKSDRKKRKRQSVFDKKGMWVTGNDTSVNVDNFVEIGDFFADLGWIS